MGSVMEAVMQILEEDVLRYEEFLNHLDQINEDDQVQNTFVHIGDVVKQVIQDSF